MTAAMHFELLLIGLTKPGIVLRNTVIGSWCGQVPAVALLVYFVEFSLFSVYAGVAIGYCMLLFLHCLPLLKVDWKEEAKIAMLRNEEKNKNLQEEDDLKEKSPTVQRGDENDDSKKNLLLSPKSCRRRSSLASCDRGSSFFGVMC